jgi:hypothetical protein
MKIIAIVILALAISVNAQAEIQPEPSNKVVVIIDGSGSYLKRQAEAIRRAVSLLEAMSRRKLYRWEKGEDSITIISLDAIPEAIWSGTLADLKKKEPDAWADRFKARKALARCTDVAEAFQQAINYLTGDPRYVSKYLFIFSDLLNEPPTDSVRNCAKPSPLPPSDFPWEAFKGVSVAAFWVPANHKLIWRKFIREKGLEQKFEIFTDDESYEVNIAPPPKPELKLSEEDISERRSQIITAAKSLGKWVLILGGAIIFLVILLIAAAFYRRSRATRSVTKKQPLQFPRPNHSVRVSNPSQRKSQ